MKRRDIKFSALVAVNLLAIAGFLLFRFFDVLKPPPIRTIDKKVHGGVGIVLDDVIAGAFAAIGVGLAAWLAVVQPF